MRGVTDILTKDTNKITRYEQRGLQKPVSITAEPNRVTVVYPQYTVEYTAEGSGLERHGIKETVTGV